MKSKCVVLVPAYQHIEPETEEGLRALEKRGFEVVRMIGFANISLARNILVERMMPRGFLHFMWIDSDIVFDPDDVRRLLDHQRMIIGGVYIKKSMGGPFACRFFRDVENLVIGKGGRLEEVRALAGGFTLVNRAVYKQMKDLPQRPYDHIGTMPEDYSFCERAAECGFDVFADTSITLGHIGRYQFTLSDMQERPTVDRLEVNMG